MIVKTRQISSKARTEMIRSIDTIRWHTLRYDALHVSLANRASFIATANAALIAGSSFLLSRVGTKNVHKGRIVWYIIVAGISLTFVFSLLSLREASRALLSKKSWRRLLNTDPPLSLFYQHSDTIKSASTYEEFSDIFKSQSLDSELESAIVNLWQLLRTHAIRYASLRKSIRQIRIATLIFIFSAVAVILFNLFA